MKKSIMIMKKEEIKKTIEETENTTQTTQSTTITQTSAISIDVVNETITDSAKKVPKINYKPSPFPNKKTSVLRSPMGIQYQ